MIFGAGPIGIMIAYLIAMNFNPSKLFVELILNAETMHLDIDLLPLYSLPKSAAISYIIRNLIAYLPVAVFQNVHLQALDMVANGVSLTS